MSHFGHKLDYQARQMAFNVYQYFKKKKLDPSTSEYQDDINLNKTVGLATGLSPKTVSRIVQEGRILKLNNEKFETVYKDREKQARNRPKRIIMDDYTKAVIRRKITDHYSLYEKTPPLIKLLQILKEENILHCGREYLRKLVLELDLKECQPNKDGAEKPETPIKWRYLNSIVTYRNENRSIFYLDEIYVNDHQSEELATASQNITIQRSAASVINIEPRLVLVDCGLQTGFVEKALLIFRSKTGEFQNHFRNYRNWITENLIPNIPPKSVIIKYIATTPVIAKPNKFSDIETMQIWLKQHRVHYDDKLKKSELLELINSSNIDYDNHIDDLLREIGHDVLILPPEYPDLNPLESVWPDLKGQLTQMALDCNFDQEALQELFAEKWKNIVNPVVKTENEDYHQCKSIDDSVGEVKVIVKEENDELSGSDFDMDS